jgi:uncharacterized membrane protein YkoI
MNLRRWLALPAALGLALAMVSSAAGYAGQVPTTIVVSPEKMTLKCDKWYTVRATVLDQGGHPILGERLRVHWSFDPVVSKKDKLKPTTSKTNKEGVAKTKVRLACKKGDRTIKATVGNASGTAVVHVKLKKKHHHDDDDKDDHDKDDHDGDDDHDHGGDGHHEDGVNRSVGNRTVSSVALVDVSSAGIGQSGGKNGTSGQAYGSVMAFTADSLPATTADSLPAATAPVKTSTDGPPIPAMLAVLAGLGILLRRFALSRR